MSIPIPTITEVVPHQMARAAQHSGLDPEPVLAALGLHGRAPVCIDGRVPLAAASSLAAWCTQRLGRDFALHAAQTGPRHSPLWAHATRPPTLADAIDSTVACWPLERDDFRWQVETDACTLRMVGAVRPTDIGQRGLLDFDIASLCLAIRRLTGHHPELYVRLPYPDPWSRPRTGPAPWGRWEHASYGWPRAEIVIDRAVTHRPLHGHNRQRTANRPTATTFEEQARWRLERSDGRASRLQVARALGISERSLNRKLAEEGTSFRTLSDRVRFERAATWLPSHTVRHVAKRLGFADSRSFRRAFQRWTGQAPAAWRARVRHLGA